MNVLTQYDESENESEYSKTEELREKITILQTNQTLLMNRINEVSSALNTLEMNHDNLIKKFKELKRKIDDDNLAVARVSNKKMNRSAVAKLTVGDTTTPPKHVEDWIEEGLKKIGCGVP